MIGGVQCVWCFPFYLILDYERLWSSWFLSGCVLQICLIANLSQTCIHTALVCLTTLAPICAFRNHNQLPPNKTIPYEHILIVDNTRVTQECVLYFTEYVQKYILDKFLYHSCMHNDMTSNFRDYRVHEPLCKGTVYYFVCYRRLG